MIDNALQGIAYYLTLSGGVSLLLIAAFYLALVSFNMFSFALERILQHMRLYHAFVGFVIYVYRGGNTAKHTKEDD